MIKVGYARVSTQKQDLVEQLEALKNFGCEKIFSGKHSGEAEDNKEQLNKLLDYIREGDVVVVTKLDRLGRSLSQCLQILDIFKKKDVGFIVLEQNIDTTKQNCPLSMAMIQLLGIFAELERSFIIERTQNAKLARIAAGDMSVIGGRRRLLSTEQEELLYKDIKEGAYTLSQLAKKYNVSKSTIFNYTKRPA